MVRVVLPDSVRFGAEPLCGPYQRHRNLVPEPANPGAGRDFVVQRFRPQAARRGRKNAFLEAHLERVNRCGPGIVGVPLLPHEHNRGERVGKHGVVAGGVEDAQYRSYLIAQKPVGS
jgi:hypothetical protein